jgi:uncharacterized coiled-coil DUF342 family protein
MSDLLNITCPDCKQLQKNVDQCADERRKLMNELRVLNEEVPRYKATLKELRKPVRHHLEAMGAFFEIDQGKLNYYISQLEITGKI